MPGNNALITKRLIPILLSISVSNTNRIVRYKTVQKMYGRASSPGISAEKCMFNQIERPSFLFLWDPCQSRASSFFLKSGKSCQKDPKT